MGKGGYSVSSGYVLLEGGGRIKKSFFYFERYIVDLRVICFCKLFSYSRVISWFGKY